MSLRQLEENVYICDLGATLTGVITTNEGTVLLDSGLNRQQAKKIEKNLNIPVFALYNTHTHADHVGGNSYFCEKYNIKARVPAGELSFMALPELECGLLYGGKPAKAMLSPFLCAEFVTDVQMNNVNVNNGIVTYSTAGHSPDHMSYLVNGILFAGDALFSPPVIDKHGILYLYDPARALESLEKLKTLEYKTAVICHKDVINGEQLKTYVEYERRHILNTADKIARLVRGSTAEEITLTLTADMGITNGGAWLLTLSTVKGYLAMLEKENIILQDYVPGKGICWKRV